LIQNIPKWIKKVQLYYFDSKSIPKWIKKVQLIKSSFDDTVKFILKDIRKYKIIIIYNMGFGISTISSALAFFYLPSFQIWVYRYNKSYANTSEYNSRQNIYLSNLGKITRHNSNNYSWKMSVNKYADLTADEFKQHIGGCVFSDRVHNYSTFFESTALPQSVNWPAVGAVTPVKNPGQCGSCWAFSTTGSVESAHYISTNECVILSEQQLVDCSGAEGNQGCNGGLMDYAFEYIIKNGITSESNYPYTAQDGSCNQQRVSDVVANISKFTDVVPNSEMALMTAVVQQPISVAIEADQDVFQFYSSGVMTGNCGTNIDHGVLAVGYGTLNNHDYWIVKNSWGADWGMNGYILLGRGAQYGASGQCGIQMDPSYPIV